MSERAQLFGGGAAGAAADRSGLLALAEAEESGRATLNRLAQQTEALDRAETVTDSAQYCLDRSNRVVRGMTWGGWIQNLLTSPPKPPPPVARHVRDGPGPPKKAADRAAVPPPPPRRTAAPPVLGGVDLGAAGAEQDAYLDSIARSLENVIDLSAGIGEEIGEQNGSTMPRLQGKIGRLREITRSVTRQAGSVAETGVYAQPRFLGHVAVRCAATRRFLAARGVDVGLEREPEILRVKGVFALFERRAGLLGFQSRVSGRWLGIGFIGSAIGCRSTTFGASEQFDMDLDLAYKQRPTRLMSGALNWGYGCWLRVNVDGAADLGALRDASLFDVIFLDDEYDLPAYAEELVVRKRRHRGPADVNDAS